MYVRSIAKTIEGRLAEPRRFIQVVMGPRQVGKTTTVRQVLEKISLPYIFFTADAVPASDWGWVSRCWDSARIKLSTSEAPCVVLVIDEIQKIQNWSEQVKREWDSDTASGLNIKVLLLGSSRVMIDKGLSESLMGRYEEIRMGHWSYAEMREAFGFTLNQYVYFGGYPGAATLIEDEERWRAYILGSIIDATINKDILMDSPVSKPALLRQTFELSAAYSGKILSLTKMTGQLQDAGNTTTLASYLNLLGDNCMVRALQKYSVDMARRRASIPKFQVYNNALCNAYAEKSYCELTSDPRDWGHALESALGAHIINCAFTNRFDVYYWREGNDEVDFILRHGQNVMAIEVKSNNERSNTGLKAFDDKFHPQKSIVVGPAGEMTPEEFLEWNIKM